ncbi:Short-chain dehydrogenase [Alteromonadaceae bacterium Bs31]|nr:Short-chain dehydrogenase [Alteromonadaceae bacterium Bs31]
MTNSNEETVWITGASSGLGLALASKLAAAGSRVIASGRNKASLDQLKGAYPDNIETLAFDLTDDSNLEEVRRALSSITDKIDRVYLNAGTCEYFDALAPQWQLMERVMRVNYLGLVNTVRLAMDFLKAAPRGHIIGIGSQASQLPFPRAEAYGASKAAVRYFLESLRMDVKQFGIDVSVILPGFIDTPLTQRNDFPMPFLMSTEQAAVRIIAAVEKRSLTSAFPRRLSFLLWFMRHFPKLWLAMNSNKRSNNNAKGNTV